MGYCVLGAATAAENIPSETEGAAVNETLAYVGTYTRGDSRGIYLFRLQPADKNGSQNDVLVPLGLAAEIANPSFLEIDPKRRLVFAVNEVSEFGGKAAGAVSAFSVDPATGKLTLLNQESTLGTGPCHLVLDHGGKHLLVANYDSGSVAVVPVGPDGRLGKASEFVQHTGSSIHPERQKAPHAHCVTLDPANRFAFVCDLGLDKVLVYRFDAENGKLTPHDPAFAATKPGAGPRHMVFRPDGRFAYVINELNSNVTAYEFDADNGVLTELHTVSTLPESYDGPNSGAEIDVHPSGRFLYASNRGRNSIAMFAIDRDTGRLTSIGDESSGGDTPRHFGIQPSGEHLAIANQNSNTLVMCRIDADSGRLKPSAELPSAPTPVCIRFLPPQRDAD